MKIKDLIKKLKEFDPESAVVLSSDAEGNSFSEATDIEQYLFDKEEGEIKEWDDPNDQYQRAIVIWP